MPQQTVIQIGNSLGVILPQRLQHNFHIGDKVSVDKKQDSIIVSPVKKTATEGVDAKFTQWVDEFSKEHADVLKKLATK